VQSEGRYTRAGANFNSEGDNSRDLAQQGSGRFEALGRIIRLPGAAPNRYGPPVNNAISIGMPAKRM